MCSQHRQVSQDRQVCVCMVSAEEIIIYLNIEKECCFDCVVDVMNKIRSISLA